MRDASRSCDTLRAPGTWPAANSAGVRTSSTTRSGSLLLEAREQIGLADAWRGAVAAAPDRRRTRHDAAAASSALANNVDETVHAWLSSSQVSAASLAISTGVRRWMIHSFICRASERLVETQRGLVPVEHGPLHAAAVAFLRRCAPARAAMRGRCRACAAPGRTNRSSRYRPGPADERRKVEEIQRESRGFAVPFGDQHVDHRVRRFELAQEILRRSPWPRRSSFS